MHKVKRAVIVAAGMGLRMKPITLKTPKPLVRVNGRRMLDTIINALHINGIFEIYVVVGYKKEQFVYLNAIDGIILIENPDFDKANNVASLYYAREHLEDCIILDGDQLVCNPDILRADYEKSGYNAVWTDTSTKEWLMEVEGDKVISCSKTGGERGWQLFSVSRWTGEDGKKLSFYLEQEYKNNHNTDIFWDDIALFLHSEDFDLGIMEMNRKDIIEIDSIKELAAIDCSYERFLGGINE